MKKKYSPSMAAFQHGELTISPYSSGCMRHIWFSAHGVREDIPAIYLEVGATHEIRQDQKLSERDDVDDYTLEVPLKGSILGADGVEYSGRADAIVKYSDGTKEVQEFKSTISKTARREVIRKGNVKLNQLAQLVSYMIQEECENGRLVAGYYELDGEDFICTEEREFVVKINDEGLILVDGEPSGYRVQDQLAHMQKAAQIIKDDVIGERPLNWQQKWGGPCSFCPMKNTCDKIDQGLSKEEALESAKQDIEQHTVHEPQINIHKRRKTK